MMIKIYNDDHNDLASLDFQFIVNTGREVVKNHHLAFRAQSSLFFNTNSDLWKKVFLTDIIIRFNLNHHHHNHHHHQHHHYNNHHHQCYQGFNRRRPSDPPHRRSRAPHGLLIRKCCKDKILFQSESEKWKCCKDKILFQSESEKWKCCKDKILF